MQVTKLNKQDFITQIQATLTNQVTNTLYCVYDDYYVLPGNSTPPNQEAIEEHQLDNIDIPSMGGSIIVCPGDVQFGLTTNTIAEMNVFLDTVGRNLTALIQKHGYSCIIHNNDVLIDEYKVASSFSRMIGNICLGGFQMSINVDLDLIKEVCTKPMVKIPKGLSEYGITTEEIEQDVVLKTASELE